jgi:hypothetical protein
MENQTQKICLATLRLHVGQAKLARRNLVLAKTKQDFLEALAMTMFGGNLVYYDKRGGRLKWGSKKHLNRGAFLYFR